MTGGIMAMIMISTVTLIMDFSAPLVILTLLCASYTCQGLRQYLNYSGDIMLGALFPVHRKGSGGVDCGRIQVEDGIQPLEAMLYTVQQINKDPHLLPGIRLGMLAFDSCDNPSYGLEQSLDFLKGFIAHFNEFHDQDFMCNDGSLPVFRARGFDQVVAVIGAQSSSVTIQVATMLRLFRIPQVSYMSTSPSLSNKDRFPYFFRTVPSDINQAHAMLEILRQFNWTYVSVVYSDNEYGTRGFETLSELAANYSICFTTPQRIDKDHFTDKDYRQVVDNIAARKDVRVVVVFAEKLTILRLLDAARQKGMGSHFVWLGSDAWSLSSHRELLSRSMKNDGEEQVLEGALAIQPLARTLSGFDEYFNSLTLDHAEVNPWFREYWKETHCEKRHYARFRSVDEAGGNMTTTPTTTTEDSLEECSRTPLNYRQQRYLHFVRDAVYSVAYALHNLQQAKCGPEPAGYCKEMEHIDGDDLRVYLSNVTFSDEGGKTFRFLDGRDGPPRYSILNFQRDDETNNYHWNIIGNYTLSEDGRPNLNIDYDVMKYRMGSKDGFPKSACSQTCAPHEVKIREGEETCCWRCQACSPYQFRKDEFSCKDCKQGYRAAPNMKKCVPIPEEFIDFQNPWAIGAMAVASLGILLTVFVALIFWTYNDTPVIKASGRELSYLLLLGILASFCVTFVIVARPTNFTCGLTRFFLGFCYTLCYAAIVTKTNRIARIFNNKGCSPHKTKYTSPVSQLVITALLTSIEVIINMSWLIYVPPTVTHTFPTQDSRLLICDGLEDHSYMVSLVYPFILIGICTAYAIKTRKCPGGFNETKHIAFTNYTAIIIWLAFVPLYIASTSNSIRIVTLALSLSLSGLVQLGCLFFPKLYIVLFKPEKNTKEVVMAQHRSSSFVATPTNLTPVVVVNGGAHYIQNNDILKSDVSDGGRAQQLRTEVPRRSPSPSVWRSKLSLKEARKNSSIMNTATSELNLVENHMKKELSQESAELRIV
ncbi:metabotropic glutamate receptor 3 [Anabrus simplex]|uniref:metabotropic glutamate receptor 3 n=1 Tax=Anabrus simplex TaxID=316456 RepID=UPI0035A2D7F3